MNGNPEESTNCHCFLDKLWKVISLYLSIKIVIFLRAYIFGKKILQYYEAIYPKMISSDVQDF